MSAIEKREDHTSNYTPVYTQLEEVYSYKPIIDRRRGRPFLLKVVHLAENVFLSGVN